MGNSGNLGKTAVKPVCVCVCTDVVSPEPLRPFPKARRRTATFKRKHTGSTKILTNMPIKAALEEEILNRRVKKLKLGKTTSKPKVKVQSERSQGATGKGKQKMVKQLTESSDSSDEEWPCIVCTEPFDTGRYEDREAVQCLKCKKWAHTVCTDGDDFYVCENCKSDAD